jgi:hypothetical protein
MRLSYLALVGAAAALPLAIYVTYTGGPSARETATGASAAPMEAAAFQASPEETVSGSHRTAEGTDKEMAALRKEVTHLRAEVSALRQQWRAQGSRQVVVTGEGEEAPPHNPRIDPAAQAEAQRRRQEQMAVLEAAFRQESADYQWSSQTAMVVQEALTSNETAQTVVRNVECRSRTCRVEVVNDGPGIPADFMPMFAMQVASVLPSITANHVEDANGVKTTILYLSRDVAEPPDEGG